MVAIGRISVQASLWAAGLFCLVVLLIYHDTAWSMVYIWSRSETFAHGFLILPISLWLIWTRRDLLDHVTPEPAFWVALLIVPLGLVWLLAWLVDVAVIQQLALIAMMIAGAWAIMGHQLGSVLCFPMFFLFFAVPMGEGLIAPMMEFTASSTVWMIEGSGIPVYREGLFFSLPSGSWSVVEACSGVRYIIASVTVGTLYAYLTYRSWTRRLLFVAVSAIVPIFANTLRAYIIVMLGHMSDMSIATGADHLIYGWVFFGLVIFVLFWLGSFFREDDIEQMATPPFSGLHQNNASAANGMLLLSLISAVLLAALAPICAFIIGASSASPMAFTFPPTRGAWIDTAVSDWRWSPPAKVSGQQSAYFERDGEVLGLVVQYADRAINDADVVGSSTLFAVEDSGWRVIMQDKLGVQGPGGELIVDEAQVRGRGVELLVWSWYLIGDVNTSNNYRAKLQQTMGRLGLSENGDYRVTVALPMQPSLAETRSRLQDFLDEYFPTLYEELRQSAVKAR